MTKTEAKKKVDDYVTMRCRTFRRGLFLLSLWYKNPTTERRMKLHGLTCPVCRKLLENMSKKDKTLAAILLEIRGVENKNANTMQCLIRGETSQQRRELMAESMYFFLDLEDTEAPPNSQPSLAFLDPRPLSRPETDPRHAHFEQTLDVDGDD